MTTEAAAMAESARDAARAAGATEAQIDAAAETTRRAEIARKG